MSSTKRGEAQERYIIRALCRTAITKHPVDKLTGMLLAQHRDKKLREVKPATVRRELAVLRHCIEIARKEWGLPIPRNPFEDLKLPSPGEGRDRRLHKGEWEIMKKEAYSSNYWFIGPFIELAIETGMRRGELLGLLWTNVDLKKQLAFLPITKNGKPRKVPLSPSAVKILGRIERTRERVFPISEYALRRAWLGLLKTCKINGLRLHDLRHKSISRFFEKGLSLPEVAVISGHRSFSMLFRYTHIRAEDIAQKLS